MQEKFDNVRRDLNTPIEELEKNYLNEDQDDFFHKKYTGKVVDNKDPSKLGRCRIRVYGLFDDTIPDSDLPWAIPDMTFIGSKIGNFIVPPVDAIVCVYFDKGDIYCPRYTCKVIDKANPSKQAGTNYPNTIVFYELDNGDAFILDRTTGKFAIGKKDAELLDLFSQTLDAILQSVVPTALGPQVLSKVLDGTVLGIKTKLETIKGSLS